MKCLMNLHYEKSVRIFIYSGPHFIAFGLNMERYEGKMRTRINPNADTFYTIYNSHKEHKSSYD